MNGANNNWVLWDSHKGHSSVELSTHARVQTSDQLKENPDGSGLFHNDNGPTHTEQERQ